MTGASAGVVPAFATPRWLDSVPVVIAVGVVVIDIALRLAVLGIIPSNRKPSSAMAWILLILLIPVPGIALFLLLGSNRVGRRRHAQQAEVNTLIRKRTADVATLQDATAPSYVGSVATLNRNLGALPALGGNSVVLLPDYRGSIAAMVAEVDQARRFVHVEFYITAWDEVTQPLFDALVAATERGVAVRLLFDHLGSRGIPGYQAMLERLAGTEIEWHPMLPIHILKGEFRRPDLRNHRKIMVVDGHTAFVGSQNLVEPGYNKPKNHQAGREWVELMCRVEGPVVAALNVIFASDWYSESREMLATELEPVPWVAGGPGELVCQVIPSGPGFVAENNLRAFTTLIYSAQHRISLTSPYFVPDESLLYAVTTAAQRGVDVELFVSEEGDQFMVYHAQCSYYRSLLEAGVRIYLYPPPYVLHSKHFTVDEDIAVLGSSNMDMRSFGLNYEVSLMILGSDIVTRMREVEDVYRETSRELTLEEWTRRSYMSRYLDNVMRLTAALQ